MQKMYVRQYDQNNHQENYEYMVNSIHGDDENGLEHFARRFGTVPKRRLVKRVSWLNGRIGCEKSASIQVADVVKMLISTIVMRER